MEDFQKHLEEEENRNEEAEEKLMKASNSLVAVKAGVEHLADKLYHLKAVSILKLITKTPHQNIKCSMLCGKWA